jgi:hypothetical protein
MHKLESASTSGTAFNKRNIFCSPRGTLVANQEDAMHTS